MRREAWEIKTIQDIATQVFSGAEITKAQLGTGNHPAVKCGDLNSKLGCHFTECISFVDGDAIRNKKYFEYGDVLVSNLGDIKTAGSTSTYLGSKRGLAGNDVTVIKHNQNPRYLSYILSAEFCRKQITKSLITGSTVVHLYASKIKQIKIPLPPRPIQDLIADVLDKWTYLQEELARELECRKKQYLYYKELLLSKDIDKWEIKTIEEIAIDISSGTEVLERQWNTGNYPAIRNKDLSDFDSHVYKCAIGVNPDLIKIKRYCSYGDLLVSHLVNPKKIGKSCVWLGEGKCLVGKNITIVKHNQNPKYLSHALSSDFCVKQISSTSHKSIYITLFPNLLKQIKIPLPPLEEQERIVSLLDPLYEMCGDAEKGIPALISVIQKQYLYYKEELLRVQGNLS